MISEKEYEKLNSLLNSLKIYCNKNSYILKHTEYEKDTNTLYRFGWFFINGYKYSICSLNFKKNIVEFENEENHEKIKFDIGNCSTNNNFKKDNVITRLVKILRIKLSIYLRSLSDKLQP